MEKLIREGTPETPTVTLDKETGKFEMKGKSFPEEARSFYQPLIDWLKNYSENPLEKTEFIINMEYYNTASSKMILEVLKILKELHNKEHKVEVHWCYPEDDEDMLEAGEDYEEILQIPFKYIAFEED